MTITEMRDEIMADMGLDTADTVLMANMFSWIKKGIRRVPLYARSRLLVATTSSSLAAALDTLALPSDFIEERHIWRVSGGSRVEIVKNSSGSFLGNHTSSGSGNPSTYIIKKNTIYFDKKESVAETIYLEYFQEQAGVSLSSTFFGGSDLAEIVEDLAKSYYCEYEEDDARADRFLLKAGGGLGILDIKYQSQEITSGYIDEK